LAHLKRIYYRLEIAEVECDMLKAFSEGDLVKIAEKYRKLTTPAQH
jgi:hypothetical protein